MTLYDEIYGIMADEFPEMGQYILKKQLRNLGLDRESISPADVPRISRALSEAALMFGRKKAKEVADRIARIEGVKEVIELQKDPGKRAEMMVDVAKSRYNAGESAEALRLFKDALKAAEGKNLPRLKAEIKRYIGNIKIRIGDFDGAESDFRAAEAISKKIFDRKGMVEAINGLGSVEWRRGNYRKAIKYLEEVKSRGEELKDFKLIGSAYMGLANTYDEMGMPDKGIYYSKLALNTLKRIGDRKGMVTIYNNLGVTYARRGDMGGDTEDFKVSADYYGKCIEMAEEIHYPVMEGWASFNMAETLAKMGNFSEATEYARRSELIFEKLGDNLGLSGALMAYAIIYREEGDFEKAGDYFERTIGIRRELKTPYRIADALYEYGLMLKKTGDPKANKVLKEAAQIFGSIANEDREREARALIEQ